MNGPRRPTRKTRDRSIDRSISMESHARSIAHRFRTHLASIDPRAVVVAGVAPHRRRRRRRSARTSTFARFRRARRRGRAAAASSRGRRRRAEPTARADARTLRTREEKTRERSAHACTNETTDDDSRRQRARSRTLRCNSFNPSRAHASHHAHRTRRVTPAHTSGKKTLNPATKSSCVDSVSRTRAATSLALILRRAPRKHAIEMSVHHSRHANAPARGRRRRARAMRSMRGAVFECAAPLALEVLHYG